jgi:uncharacterized protein YndB with AHSA1/START domain
MTESARGKFVYVTYIRTTAQKLWDALTTPEFTRQYWFGVAMESNGGWKKGAAWKMTAPNGKLTDEGEVVESNPPSRLVITWHHRLFPDAAAEGAARCTFDLVQEGPLVKLTVTHEAGPKLLAGVSDGWPRILSSLKSLLEGGEALANTRDWPKGM